jgi:hypothetical protein
MNQFFLALALTVAAGLALLGWQVRRRRLARWLVPCCLQAGKRRAPGADEEVHLLLCIADHFEPKHGRVPPEAARARVQRWVEEYPRQFAHFRDSDDRPPRHTFFYPMEEYDAEHLDLLAELCRAGYGEVEIHLHHDHDTAHGLREKLLAFKELLAQRHGLLARDRNTGAPSYGFVHGNWALCNSRPDGSWCGINNELTILRETGCYADFTFPSAPDPTQPAKVNSLYYAWDKPGRPRSHDTGVEVGPSIPPEDALLLIQGPLVLNWSSRKWGLFPRLENGCLQESQPPDVDRLKNWLRARVQAPQRPDWFFVKLHAHGATEEAADVLLGATMVHFHEELARLARENRRFQYHYVTARELYNLVKAAEAGWRGSVAEALDYQLIWTGKAAGAEPAAGRCHLEPFAALRENRQAASG